MKVKLFWRTDYDPIYIDLNMYQWKYFIPFIDQKLQDKRKQTVVNNSKDNDFLYKMGLVAS